MRKNSNSTAYVIDDKMKFLGVISLDDARKVKAGEFTFTEAITKDVPITRPDTPIAELIPIAAEAKLPIAVLDKKQRLKGIVSKAAVLASLS